MKAVAALKDCFGMAPVLKVLGVAASTCYGWLTQECRPSPRRRSQQAVPDDHPATPADGAEPAPAR